MPEFTCDGPIDAHIRTSSGTVQIVAEERSTVQVAVEPEHNNDASIEAAEATRVEMIGNALHIEAPTNRGFRFAIRSVGIRIIVRMPVDSRVECGTASADVTMEGRYGSSSINTASGDIRVDEIAGDFARKSASGDSDMRLVAGDLNVDTASGDLRVKSVGGDLRLRSASGDVTIDSLGASAHLTTASGDIRIGSIHTGEANIKTASGDVTIGVAEGTGVWLDINTLSGDTRSELEMTGGPSVDKPTALKLGIHTLSGDVLLRRAAPVVVPTMANDIDSD
jgi:DUF4097 and DUF4098 domain-containing protein YvlB